MATFEELKKLAEENGVELTEDMLDMVAGGAYTKDEWDAMTPEERKAAQDRSIMAKIMKKPCELD